MNLQHPHLHRLMHQNCCQAQMQAMNNSSLLVPHVQNSQYSSKFRRLEEKTQLKEEISLVVETKVICCLDLLLQLFAQKYGQPGYQLPTTVGHPVWGTSVGIKWKCAVGHNAKFWSSHNVNGVLASDLEACAAVLL